MGAPWIDVGAEADLKDGRTLAVDVDGDAVLVARCADGYHAIEDRCTHDGAPLSGGEIEDCEIICPRHFSHFCLKTGAALTPPAYEPVRTYEIRAENGRLLVRAG